MVQKKNLKVSVQFFTMWESPMYLQHERANTIFVQSKIIWNNVNIKNNI